MFNNVLMNLGVYLDGICYLGIASEVQLPKIKIKTAEWNATGMSGVVDIDTGKTEKMEATIKLNGIQADPIKAMGHKEAPLVIRGSLRDSKGNDKKLLIEMRGLLTEYDNGTLNAEATGETSLSMTLSYYRFNADGKDLIEVDPINNIRNIEGKNQLEGMLANISG